MKRPTTDIFKTVWRVSLMITALLFFSSCVHEWEEDEPTPSMPDVDFTLRLDFTLALPPYTDLEYELGMSRNPDDFAKEYDIRHKVLVLSQEEGSRDVLYEYTFIKTGALSQNVELRPQLPAGRYRFLVWTDYVPHGSTTDYHYVTSNPAAIALAQESYGSYSGCDDSRDAFRGVSVHPVDVDSDNLHVITMERPMGKYRFISTDFDAFLDRLGVTGFKEFAEQYNSRGDASQRIPGFSPEDFTVKVRYTGYLPSVFNMFTNLPGDASLGVAYQGEFEYLGGNEVQLAFDYVLVNGKESVVDAAIEVYNKRGDLLARTPPMTVPLQRGGLTTVRGNFLTTMSSGAIGVDPGFAGSFDIIIK